MRPEAGGAADVVRSATAAAGELHELAHLQRELQRLIGEPCEGARDLEAAASAIGCDAEQIAVYRRMGAVRFVREVAREFPATRALLGRARFDSEARAFVARTASRSYTLDGYARGFPQQLRRRARASGDAALGAAAELARLERECLAVRRAPARRRACSRARADASAEQRSPQLRAAPGARVRRFACDVETALACFEHGTHVRAPSRSATRLALFRRDGRVVRLRVAHSEASLLAGLLRGETLERAVARAVRAGLAPAAIGSALERWVAARLLAATRLAGASG